MKTAVEEIVEEVIDEPTLKENENQVVEEDIGKVDEVAVD